MNLVKMLFGLDASVNQRTYVTAGIGLALLKYAIDFIVVFVATGKYWSLFAYLSPLIVLRSESLRPAPELLLWGMAAYALPFAWVGFSMSVRRAADAGRTPWLGVLFLLPGVNWLVILFLSLQPTRGAWIASDAGELVPLRLRTALLSVGIGVALSMSMVATSVYVLQDYGWSLFIATPFVVGAVAGYLTNRSGERSTGAAIPTVSATRSGDTSVRQRKCPSGHSRWKQGAQSSGGNSLVAWKEIGNSLGDVGFPIIEAQEDGSFVVTKHPNTGGLVSVHTVAEQILYEALHPYPDDLVIATKAGLTRTGPGEWVPVGIPSGAPRDSCPARG